MTARADLPYLRRRARPGRGVPVRDADSSRTVGTAATATGSPEPAAVRNSALAAFVSSRSSSRSSTSPSSLSSRPPAPGAGSFESLLGIVPAHPAPPPSRFHPLPPALPGVPGIRQGEDRILRRGSAPVVMLSRTQSGTGALQCVLEGPLHGYTLGCAYETTAGKEGAVHRSAAPSLRRPMLLVGDTTVTVDLRQVSGLRRLLVYATSPSEHLLKWEGTLVVSTLGGQKIYLPCSGTSPSFVLMSIYNVDGHLVIRAEDEPILGPPQQVCEAYDYDHILWRDGFTPFTTDSSGH